MGNPVGVKASQKRIRIRGLHALFFLVQHKAMLIERRVLLEDLDVHQQVFLFKQTVGFLDSAFQEPRVDRAFVDFKKRHVAVKDLVQQDDELDEVRIGLLPKRLFAAAKEVVEQ